MKNILLYSVIAGLAYVILKKKSKEPVGKFLRRRRRKSFPLFVQAVPGPGGTEQVLIKSPITRTKKTIPWANTVQSLRQVAESYLRSQGFSIIGTGKSVEGEKKLVLMTSNLKSLI